MPGLWFCTSETSFAYLPFSFYTKYNFKERNLYMSWFNPGRQLSLTQSLGHSLPGGIRERIGKVKVRKLICWDKSSLLGKAKATGTSKANQGMHSLHLIGRQVFSHHQGSILRNDCLGKQMQQLLTSCLLPSLSVIDEQDILRSRKFSRSVGVSCLCCITLPLLVHLLPTDDSQCETEVALMLCQCRLAIAKTSVCYQHRFQHKPIA